MTPGEALRRRRKMMDLTLPDLADKAQVSRSTIYRIEAGKFFPQVETAARVCRALGWPDDAIHRMLAGEDPAAFVTAKETTLRNEDANLKERVWELETRVAALEAMLKRRAPRRAQ